MTVLDEKIEQIQTDADLLHQVVHGDATTDVMTEGGPVRTLAKIEAELMSSAVITGAATTIVSEDLTPDRVLVSDANGKVGTALAVSATELGRLDGVTSNVQTQLNDKLSTGGGTLTNMLTYTTTTATRHKTNTANTGYGVLSRNDNTNYYFLITNLDDADGTFNALRPFFINLATGNISMGHNLSVGGAFSVTGAVTLGGKLLTIGGNLTTAGAYATTFTMTGATSVTFPTSGTLLSSVSPSVGDLNALVGNSFFGYSDTTTGASLAPSGAAFDGCGIQLVHNSGQRTQLMMAVANYGWEYRVDDGGNSAGGTFGPYIRLWDSSNLTNLNQLTNGPGYVDAAGARAAITGAASTVAASNLTAGRAVVSDANGKLSASAATWGEVGFLSGVTSAIQPQLDAKASISGTETLTNKTLESPTLTGVPTAPTATAGSTGDQIATLDFVNEAVGAAGGGGGAMELLGSATVSSPVSYIDFLNIFTSDYDKYIIEVQKVWPIADDSLRMYLASGGEVLTDANYYAPAVSGSTALGSSIVLAPTTSSIRAVNQIGITCTIEVRNVNSAVTNGFKGVSFRGHCHTTASAMEVFDKHGGYSSSTALSGFRLFFAASQNFAGGTVRVYGIKNS